MNDLISRKAAIDALGKESLITAMVIIDRVPSAQTEMDCMLKEYGDCTYSETGCSGCAIKANIKKALKSAQPEPCDDPRADVYYLAEKIGIHRLYSLVVDLRGEPEMRHCVNCGRTANNGGWYKDGKTRCPIEEHYALPKDGYCHLWQKIKVWEDESE